MDWFLKSAGFRDTSNEPAHIEPPRTKGTHKRIIICCDGTWQSSTTNQDNIPSNVTRLTRYLAKTGIDDQQNEWQQVIYYDAGIGTGVNTPEATRQGMTGSGFVGNVIEAYNFIVLNYKPGDKIFCFGFSRGAYTARAVAGLVTDIGIIRPIDMQDFPNLYVKYRDHTQSHKFRKSKSWREWVEGERLFDPTQKDLPNRWQESPVQWKKRPHGEPSELTRWVEAVGVFDTVGSLGVPDIEGLGRPVFNLLGRAVPIEKFGFHNVTLSPYIKHAYHAMALDERRKPFNTTMWHYPDNTKLEKPKFSKGELGARWEKVKHTDGATEDMLNQAWGDLVDAQMFEELEGANSELLQVWFPGYHINIGGGNDDLLKKKEGDFEQISMITLAWMVEQLRPHIAFEADITHLWDQDRILIMRPVVEKLLADNAKGHWLVKKIHDLLAKQPEADPWNDGNKTRKSVLAADALRGWAVGPIPDSMTLEFKFAGSEHRSPGEYKVGDKFLGVERTNEYIHPCVKYRMDHGEGYNPASLRGFRRQKRIEVDGKIGYDWVKNDVKIPEYKIEKSSYERSCIVSGSAVEFLGKLDEGYKIALDAPMQLSSSGCHQHGF